MGCFAVVVVVGEENEGIVREVASVGDGVGSTSVKGGAVDGEDNAPGALPVVGEYHPLSCC